MGAYIVPGALARGESVLEVVDGVPGTLANSTLRGVSYSSKLKPRTRNQKGGSCGVTTAPSDRLDRGAVSCSRSCSWTWR